MSKDGADPLLKFYYCSIKILLNRETGYSIPLDFKEFAMLFLRLIQTRILTILSILLFLRLRKLNTKLSFLIDASLLKIRIFCDCYSILWT